MRKAQSDFDRHHGRTNGRSTADERVGAALALAQKFAERETS